MKGVIHGSPPSWKVQADPEFKGKHPYHDSRYITSSHFEFDDSESEGSIICKMTDHQHQREFAHLIAAAPQLLEAAELMLAFYDDLSKSNPGFMGKLCLQDYARWNEALLKLPNAIAKAKGAK